MKYIALDGKTFLTKEECSQHEYELNEDLQVMADLLLNSKGVVDVKDPSKVAPEEFVVLVKEEYPGLVITNQELEGNLVYIPKESLVELPIPMVTGLYVYLHNPWEYYLQLAAAIED